MIYFLQSGSSGPIKIGYSSDPDRRVRSLETGSSGRLTLLGTLEAPQRMEHMLHKLFVHSHSKGEWYYPTPLLLSFIDAAKEMRSHITKELHLMALGDRPKGDALAVDEIFDTWISQTLGRVSEAKLEQWSDGKETWNAAAKAEIARREHLELD